MTLDYKYIPIQSYYSLSNMNTFKFLNSASIQADTFSADLSALRTKLFNNGICWTDDVKGEFCINKPFRVILYTRRGKIDFKNPMVKECNGLIVEYDNGWNLLAMPQNAFCTNKISMKKLGDLFTANNYDVYEVLDATILTLYYYKDQWCISSTKGYDIGDVEMVNGMTYMGAIEDLMESKYKSFRFEDLTKRFSYTIALRHSKYHIFDETKHLANRTKNIPRAGVDMNSYIMVLSIANTATGSFIQKHVPGLPFQSPIPLKEYKINTMTGYARCAYAKYEKGYRLQSFKYKPLYGYILRAKNSSVPSDYSTIYIESDLYKAIKIAIYKDNRDIVGMDYDHLVVQMSMNHDRYEQFRIMFQQFESKFQQLDELIENISAEVVYRITTGNNEIVPTDFIQDLTDQFKNEADVTVGVIKDAMYSKNHLTNIFNLLK